MLHRVSQASSLIPNVAGQNGTLDRKRIMDSFHSNPKSTDGSVLPNVWPFSDHANFLLIPQVTPYELSIIDPFTARKSRENIVSDEQLENV